MSTPLLRYGWPLFAGNLLLFLLSFLGNAALPYLLAILLLTPLTMTAVQGRAALLHASVGLIAGSLLGLLLGYALGPAITGVLAAPGGTVGSGVSSELLLWWSTGASFCASLSAFAAGELGRRHSAARTTR